jgi:hypothetical protein
MISLGVVWMVTIPARKTIVVCSKAEKEALIYLTITSKSKLMLHCGKSSISVMIMVAEY